MRFSMPYSGEQILSFKSCLVFYAGDSLILGFWLIDIPIVSLTCQNWSCISKLISEWKLYVLCQLNHNLIITYYYN